jgi:alginate O-acetyltransferase complex protein AlgI
MLFTEPRFLFYFLPIVLAAYYLLPRAGKNALLLAASVWFYGIGEGYYTAVVMASIVFNYFQGHFIDMKDDPKWRKQTLAFGIFVNLLLLVVFKYAAFVVDNLNLVLAAASVHIPRPKIHLPVGISFFTFHALSYLTDIYRREVKPMRRFDSFSLYITLFPQLVAGPIIRYKTICDQFEIAHTTPHGISRGRVHSADGFAEGVRRFILGLGKKLLIADTLARTADAVFDVPGAGITPAAAWLGIACYALQIYFDFSGYSDMAIGLARMVGFQFPENFNYPYVARSVTEFWRRWHISLSSWFRDYLYIPLGGNRVSPRRTYLNLMTVFFLCGLWHGATWNFVLWGVFHGTFLILERAGFGKILEKFPRPLQHAYTLLVVLIAWVPFRADTLPHTLTFLAKMAFLAPAATADAPVALFLNNDLLIALAAGILGSMPWMPAMISRWGRFIQTSPSPRATAAIVAGHAFELASLAAIFLTSAAASAASTYSPFIYYRF